MCLLYFIRYDYDHRAYLTLLTESLSAHSMLNFLSPRGTHVVPFSEYGSAGYYSGLVLSVSLFKRHFNRFFASIENYIQMHAQLQSDDCISVDDTFKFAKHVYVSMNAKKFQMFEASLTVCNGNGTIAVSRLKYGKTQSEILPLLEDFKLSRSSFNAPMLKPLNTDNVNSDAATYRSVFPSLVEGTSCFNNKSGNNNNARHISLSRNKIAYYTTADGVNRVVNALVNNLQNNRSTNEKNCIRS